MKCNNCKQHIDDDSWFCDQCGTRIYICPECHIPGKGEGKRCGMCGTKLVSAESLASGKNTGPEKPEEPPKAPADDSRASAHTPPAPATRLVCRQENMTLQLQNGAVLGRLEGPYQHMLSRLEYVSARHAQLWQEGDHWIISDLGSRNGTAVNGEWCYNPLPFRKGDTVRLANYYDFIAE